MAALVKDYMIAKKEIVTPDDSVASAIDLMIENDIGSVIVEDENRNIVGIFTERDLLRRYRQNQSKFLRLTISEVMTQPVITIEEGAKLSDAITLMEENKIGRLPVVDGDKHLVGILFWRELFNRLSLAKL